MKSLKDSAVLSDLVAKKNAEIAELKKKLLELSSDPKYTQEDLDEYTNTHSFVDCLDFYDRLKEKGLDVYMIPVERLINTCYRYYYAETGEYKDIEHADYRRWLEAYEKSITGQHVKKVFARPPNPNHKYLYTIDYPWIQHETASLKLFNFDIRRIYTLTTWNQEMPTNVRNLIYRMEQLVCIDKANKLKDIEEEIKKNPLCNPQKTRNTVWQHYCYPTAFKKCHEKLYDLLLDHLLSKMPTQSM
jgi:hypothetical protein